MPLQHDAASQMSHLTRLFIDGAHVSETALQQLPCSLQELILYGPYKAQQPGNVPGMLSLQHLVNPKDLSWCWLKEGTIVQLVLPQQVTSIELTASFRAELPPGLLYASIGNPGSCMPVLEQLTALRGLQDLMLGRDCAGLAGGSLDVPHAQRLAHVLGSMSSTQLTFLHINCRGWRSQWDVGVELGMSLQKLSALKHLHVQQVQPSEADAVRLTSLANLTHLALPYAGDGVSSAVVLRLACAVTGLVFLDVGGCGLRCPVVLPVLERLTRVEALRLHENDLVLDDARLFLLTGLGKLTALSIPIHNEVSDEGVRSFLALIPWLKKVVGVDWDGEALLDEEDESEETE
jgi:hypothetical protein